MGRSSLRLGGPVCHCQALNNAPHEEVKGHRPLPFSPFYSSYPSSFFSLPPPFPLHLLPPPPSPISRCAAPGRSTQNPRTLARVQSPRGAGPVGGAGQKEEGAGRGGEGAATPSLGQRTLRPKQQWWRAWAMGARSGTAAPSAVAGADATATTTERKTCVLTRVAGVQGRLRRPRSPVPQAPGRAAQTATDSRRSVRRTTAAASWYEVRGQPRLWFLGSPCYPSWGLRPLYSVHLTVHILVHSFVSTYSNYSDCLLCAGH